MSERSLFPLDAFKGALHLELFNLQDGPSPTLATRRIRQCAKALMASQEQHFCIQRKPPSRLRPSLARECGNAHFNIVHPAQLPQEHRSTTWQLLVDAVCRAQREDRWRQTLLIRLLSALGLHGCAENLFAAEQDAVGEGQEADLQFANALARARFLTHQERGHAYRKDYRPHDYWQIVHSRCADSPAVCSATTSLMLQYITEEPDLAQVQSLAQRVRRQVQGLSSGFARDFGLSVFHRAYALVPARERNWHDMVHHMVLADQHAGLALEAGEGYEASVALENRCNVLQSRVKERLLVGDPQGAARFASQLVQLDPLDPRVLMSAGEAFAAHQELERAASCYGAAAQCGATGTAAAWFMAGRCHAALGESEQATACLLESWRVDPGAAGAVEALARLIRRESSVSRQASESCLTSGSSAR